LQTIVNGKNVSATLPAPPTAAPSAELAKKPIAIPIRCKLAAEKSLTATVVQGRCFSNRKVIYSLVYMVVQGCYLEPVTGGFRLLQYLKMAREGLQAEFWIVALHKAVSDLMIALRSQVAGLKLIVTFSSGEPQHQPSKLESATVCLPHFVMVVSLKSRNSGLNIKRSTGVAHHKRSLRAMHKIAETEQALAMRQG